MMHALLSPVSFLRSRVSTLLHRNDRLKAAAAERRVESKSSHREPQEPGHDPKPAKTARRPRMGRETTMRGNKVPQVTGNQGEPSRTRQGHEFNNVVLGSWECWAVCWPDWS